MLQAQKLVQYLRECEDVLDWINDKVYYYLPLLDGKFYVFVWESSIDIQLLEFR